MELASGWAIRGAGNLSAQLQAVGDDGWIVRGIGRQQRSGIRMAQMAEDLAARALFAREWKRQRMDTPIREWTPRNYR